MANLSKKIEILSLNPDNISSFSLNKLQELTKPRFYCYFEGKDPSDISFSKILALVAVDEDKKPLALALVTVLEQNANLDWFYVDPEKRNLGIGQKLMAEMLNALKIYRVVALNTLYPLNQPYTPALLKLFEKFHWSNDRPFLKCLHLDRKTCHAPWMDKALPLPKDYSEFNWKRLTATEKKQLESKLDQMSILPEFSPFRRPHLIDYRSSFGIRYKNEVVGYAINHTEDEETVEFKVLWAEPEHLSKGIGFYMIRRTIELVLKAPTPPYAVIYIKEHNAYPSWANFIEKRIMPCTDKVFPIHMIWHSPIKLVT